MSVKAHLSVGFALLAFITGMEACGGSDSGSDFGNGSADGGAGSTGSGLGGNLGNTSDGGASSLVGAACATATAAASKQPVYMLIVLDGSGSMSQENKWTAVVPALDAIFDSIKQSDDPSFGVGLNGFSDDNDSTNGNGPYPGKHDVPIGFVDATQAAALHGRIDHDSPSGRTPTLRALTGSYKELEGFTASGTLQPNGKKVLVLMTDGVPTDSSTSDNVNLAKGELAKASPAGPITTFVVGVGDFPSADTNNFDPSFLGQVAVAGGAAPTGCNPKENMSVSNVCYFEVDPSKATTPAALTQAFEDAINKIRGQISSCTFTLSKTSTVDPTKVNVVYTSGAGVATVIGEDPTNGWSYDNPTAPTAVTLHGTSCDSVKNDPKGAVSITIGCPTVVGATH